MIDCELPDADRGERGPPVPREAGLHLAYMVRMAHPVVFLGYAHRSHDVALLLLVVQVLRHLDGRAERELQYILSFLRIPNQQTVSSRNTGSHGSLDFLTLTLSVTSKVYLRNIFEVSPIA